MEKVLTNGVIGTSIMKARVESSLNTAQSKNYRESYEDGITELVKRAQDGDLVAYRSIIDSYHKRIFSIAYGILGNREDAEDVQQETCIKLYRNINSFRGQSSFYTWLYRIVVNLCLDLGRKKKRRKDLNSESISSNNRETKFSEESFSDSLTSGSVTGPEEAFERHEIQRDVDAALNELSEQHRAVIMLREVDGLSYEEISSVVGCTKGTVMSRLHHARKKLQQCLSSYSFGGAA
jgi:RNA polymerase sigma-70 factor (ECF subfamily)